MKSILDFDQTVTTRHSFHRARIEGAEPTIGWYEAGKQNAREGGARPGIESFLTHGTNNISAIATFHNNPAYVAGHIAHILRKELTFVKTDVSDGRPAVAIDEYSIEGGAPFLISYLPYRDWLFQTNMQILGNKNSQIEFIRFTWHNMGLITASSPINFYDDSLNNYNWAQELLYISGHLVSATENSFTILSRYTSQLEQEQPEMHALDDASQPIFLPAPESNQEQPEVHALDDASQPIFSTASVLNQEQPEMHLLDGASQPISSSINISMTILSGFIAVAGIAAVAVAFTLLHAAVLNPVGLVVAVLGAGSALLGLGLFARSKINDNQMDYDNSPAPPPVPFA